MATIIVLPSHRAARTAIALEQMGYRVDPITGRAYPRPAPASSGRTASLIHALRRSRTGGHTGGGHHDPAA